MIDIIQNNPFRILGVYADASAADIKRNETKIRRYLEVGKSVSFLTDELGNLPAPIRTIESIDKALSLINLPREKLYHALFWFSKDNSCCFNECVDTLLTDDLGYGFAAYFRYLKDNSNSVSIQEKVLGNVMFELSEVKDICLDGLLTIEKSHDTLFYCDAFMEPEDYPAAKQKFISGPINTINSCISAAKNADKSTPDKCLQAGKTLMKSSKNALDELRTLIDDDSDDDYQRIADSLAKQILQCGINYYNETDDKDKIKKALELQEYALSIAVGKMTKDRCQQNVDILHRHQEQAGTEKDVEALVKLLQGLDSRPANMVSAMSFVDECLPRIEKLRAALGKSNDFYIKVCSAVANNALGFAIKLVNSDSDSKSLAKSAMTLIEKIEALDVDLNTRKRIASNKFTLKTNIDRMPSGFEKIDDATGGCLGGILAGVGEIIIRLIVMAVFIAIIAGIAQMCS